MKLKQIISKSRDVNQMEVIAREPFERPRTLHIHKENNTWKYFAGCDNNGKKIFLLIII